MGSKLEHLCISKKGTLCAFYLEKEKKRELYAKRTKRNVDLGTLTKV